MSDEDFERYLASLPPWILVVCPICHAAVTAKCTTQVRDGTRFVEQPHPERIQLAGGVQYPTK